jgi:hypothetical protein
LLLLRFLRLSRRSGTFCFGRFGCSFSRSGLLRRSISVRRGGTFRALPFGRLTRRLLTCCRCLSSAFACSSFLLGRFVPSPTDNPKDHEK